MLLVSLLQTEREREQFRGIYKDNYLKMYHIALGYLKQQEDAENAVQDAFLALAENFEKYSYLSGREMTGLCVSIVKNKAIDMIRRRKRYSEAELEELVLYDERTEANPEDALGQEQAAGALQRALEQISEVFRETLILKYYYGLSNREIAKIQGVSAKTVEMRLYRGKQKLKVVLDEEEKAE